MTRKEQEKRFQELLQEMAAMRKRKNSDYATNADSLSNLRECEALGIPAYKGVIIRMSDKWSRLKQLAVKGVAAVKNETVKDTLLDLSVYCLLAIMLYEERGRKN